MAGEENQSDKYMIYDEKRQLRKDIHKLPGIRLRTDDPSQHSMLGHRRPVSKKPLKWCIADRLIIARFKVKTGKVV